MREREWRIVFVVISIGVWWKWEGLGAHGWFDSRMRNGGVCFMVEMGRGRGPRVV